MSCTIFPALAGGCSPHSPSISRSPLTTLFGDNTSIAIGVRGCHSVISCDPKAVRGRGGCGAVGNREFAENV